MDEPCIKKSDKITNFQLPIILYLKQVYFKRAYRDYFVNTCRRFKCASSGYRKV